MRRASSIGTSSHGRALDPVRYVVEARKAPFERLAYLRLGELLRDGQAVLGVDLLKPLPQGSSEGMRLWPSAGVRTHLALLPTVRLAEFG
jgi:hypothetical protein